MIHNLSGPTSIEIWKLYNFFKSPIHAIKESLEILSLSGVSHRWTHDFYVLKKANHELWKNVDLILFIILSDMEYNIIGKYIWLNFIFKDDLLIRF